MKIADPTQSSKKLAELITTFRPSSVTWLNHFSLQLADFKSLECLDLIAIDGTALQIFLRLSGRYVSRTSADLLVPSLKQMNSSASFCVIGGSEFSNEKCAERLGASYRSNGFDSLVDLLDDPREYSNSSPTYTLVGLGTPLQDQVLARLRQVHPTGSILTCGGWIDQYSASQQYFPPIIHALRLGWLLRIVREPRRLIRRYSIDALNFLVRGNRLVSRLNRLEGFAWTRFGLVKVNSALGAALLDQDFVISKSNMKRRHDT